MTTTIRIGIEADYQLLDGLEARSDLTFLRIPGFEAAVNEPRMANELGPDTYPGSLLFIAEDDAPVGYIHARDLDDCLFISQVSVVPEAQEKGVGTALLEAVAASAKRQGKRGVTLTTFRDVPWNAPFYLKRGFHFLEDAEMGPGLSAHVVTDIARCAQYGARCVMGRFFAAAH
jgi:GNAT superfamily N-acetyltransferase